MGGALSSRHGTSDSCVIVVVLLSVPERFLPPLSVGAPSAAAAAGQPTMHTVNLQRSRARAHDSGGGIMARLLQKLCGARRSGPLVIGGLLSVDCELFACFITGI